MSSSNFIFDTEFTSDGNVLDGSVRSFYPREEVEEISNAARAEGESAAINSAHARALNALENFVQKYDAIHAGLTQAATTLRAESAELALLAAKKIAGTALDNATEEAAKQAITEIVTKLKDKPTLVITVSTEALPHIQACVDQLQARGQAGAIRLESSDTAQMGDWRIDWAEGIAAFSREQMEEAVEQAVKAHLNNPVDEQLDLFSAA